MARTTDDDAEKEICENETEEDMDITGVQDNDILNNTTLP